MSCYFIKNKFPFQKNGITVSIVIYIKVGSCSSREKLAFDPSEFSSILLHTLLPH